MLLINFYKLKRLAVVAAVILIPFVAIVLLHAGLNSQSKPASQDIKNIEQLKMPVDKAVAKDDEGIGFFSEFRIERERVRGKQLELLRDIADNPDQEQKVRDSAALKLVQIADDLSREMQTETLIRAKGYKECAVILDPAGLTIILDSQDVTDEQKDELLELSSAVSGVEKSEITITPRQK